MNMPLDYTLIAGILGEYLGRHREHEAMITKAIVRTANALRDAPGGPSVDAFMAVVEQTSGVRTNV